MSVLDQDYAVPDNAVFVPGIGFMSIGADGIPHPVPPTAYIKPIPAQERCWLCDVNGHEQSPALLCVYCRAYLRAMDGRPLDWEQAC